MNKASLDSRHWSGRRSSMAMPRVPAILASAERFCAENGFAVVVFLVSRCVIFALASVSVRLVPSLFIPANPQHAYLSLNYPALDAMCRWDCWHYITLADKGYLTGTNTNFWPLYPWTVRGASHLFGLRTDVAAMLVAQLASLASFIVVYDLFRRIEGTRAARWALLIFAFYPFSFFQSAGYPESMMVLWTAAAVSLAHANKHIWAGVALALALMSRHLGLSAGVSLVAFHILWRGFNPRRLLLTVRIFGLVIPFLALGIWSWYCKKTFGDPISYLHAREEWGGIAWQSTREAIKASDLNIESWAALALIPTAGAIALTFRRRWWGLAPFAIFLMGIVLSVGAAGLGRYSAECWPAFLPVGAWLAHRRTMAPLALASLALAQGVWLFLYVHQWRIL